MSSIWQSLKRWVPAIGKGWFAVVPGGVAALMGFMQDAFGGRLLFGNFLIQTSVPTWTWYTLSVAGMLGGSFWAFHRSQEEIDALRTVLTPKLGISAPLPSLGVVQPGSIQVRYVHVNVDNLSATALHGCRVRVMSIQRRGNDGSVAVGPVSEPLHLVTASLHEQKCIMHAGMPQRWDLAMTSQQEPGLRLAPTIFNRPYILEDDFFRPHGEYEFRIAASSDNAPSAEATIVLTWTGEWESLSERRID